MYAFLDADDAHHERARRVVEEEPGPFLMSPFVLAELDCLVQRRLGTAAEFALLDDVEADVYRLVPFDTDDLARATTLQRHYGDLGIGLADASVAVVAARHRIVRLLTTDERHFRAVRPLRGGDAFDLALFDGAPAS
ncbi:MAG: PIN domain-containing protein [Microlunatus sp.]|nr:PIN domain-containing protein [Microlunatus sp.]